MPISAGTIPTFRAGFGDPAKRRMGVRGMAFTATESGTAGRTVVNPTETYSGFGITSAFTQGQMNPARKRLFGRLGPTSSHTAVLHPEISKSFSTETGVYRAFQNPYVRSTDVRKEPGLGTAEGQRYWETLRKEVSGAEQVFEAGTGKWGSRNIFRYHLNQMLTPGSVEYESMITGMSPRRIREKRAMGVDSGYKPDFSWRGRLAVGKKPQEAGSSIDTTQQTIRTEEGTHRI